MYEYRNMSYIWGRVSRNLFIKKYEHLFLPFLPLPHESLPSLASVVSLHYVWPAVTSAPRVPTPSTNTAVSRAM